MQNKQCPLLYRHGGHGYKFEHGYAYCSGKTSWEDMEHDIKKDLKDAYNKMRGVADGLPAGSKQKIYTDPDMVTIAEENVGLKTLLAAIVKASGQKKIKIPMEIVSNIRKDDAYTIERFNIYKEAVGSYYVIQYDPKR